MTSKGEHRYCLSEVSARIGTMEREKELHHGNHSNGPKADVADDAHRRLREEVPALKEKKMKVAHGFHKVPQTGVICAFTSIRPCRSITLPNVVLASLCSLEFLTHFSR